MGGGLGRAQGGYDEMVFRAMVRDDADFYDPLGARLQGHRGRFPDRRQRLPLRHAVHELPRAAVLARRSSSTGCGAPTARSATTPTTSSACSASRSTEAWQDWMRWEHEFQAANLDVGAAASDHAVHGDRPPRSRRHLARLPQSRPEEPVRRRALSRPRPALVRDYRWRTARSGTRRGSRGAMPYRVTSLAYDAATETLFYTTDNTSYRNLLALRPQDRIVPDAAAGGAHRRPRLQSGRSLAVGPAHQQRLRHARAHAVSVPRVAERPRLPVRRGAVRPRHFARRQAGVAVAGRAGRGAVGHAGHAGARDADRAPARRRRDAACTSSSSARPCPRASCSRRTAVTSTAVPITRACPTSIATTSRPASSRRSATRRPATSARCRSTTRTC